LIHFIAFVLIQIPSIMEGEKTTTSPTENHPGSAPVAALQQFYEALDRMSPEEYAAKEKKLVRKIDQ
jgi:hypothetical protein